MAASGADQRTRIAASPALPALDRTGEILKPYVPRLAIEWLRDSPDDMHLALEGSLAFVDISGFTALTERFARKGKLGAELMRDTLDGVFRALLDEAYDYGAGLLKWGGDALLLLYDGEDHEQRACRAAWEMQRTLDRVGRLRVGGGTVALRMSVGITTGTIHFFLTGSVHRELLIAGPTATEAVLMETIADAGEIAVSPVLAAALDRRWLGPRKDTAILLAGPPDVARERAPDVGDISAIDIAVCIPAAARAHVLLERSEPEHRTVTAAFIDLMDTDRLLAELGPQGLGHALDERIRSIQDVALDFEVPFYETDIGTGSVKVLLTAGVPSSTGHDEERVLRALRAIVDRPGIVPMRVGVNTGNVFTGDFGPPYRRSYRVFGDAINTAARVMSKAAPGQILSTESVLNRSRTTFETTPVEPFHAKGKAEPLRASIIGPIVGTRDERRRETPLVGRERELSALLSVMDDVRAGTAWTIEITGEAGLGKSRLVEGLLERSPGIHVLRSRCAEYEAATPYFALREPLRAVLGLETVGADADIERRLRDAVALSGPALAPWLPLLGILVGLDLPHTPETQRLEGQFLRERLAEVAMEFLVSLLAGAPAVLVVEDVHFIDEASRDLLHRLSQAGSGLRQALLVTHREPAAVFAADDDAAGLHSISFCLLPLQTTHMVELVELVTDDDPLPPHHTEVIARRSGGNALFLFELLDAVRDRKTIDALPDTVEALITGDIDRLSPSDRTVLRYASVLGASFDPSLLAAAVRDEVEVDGAIWARLTALVNEEPGGTMRFRNMLTRDAAYEGLSYRRRRVLHERVGEAIEERMENRLDQELGTLAMHFHEAQRYEKAWEYCRQAGDRARDLYANVDAARLYERALIAGRRLRGTPAADLAAVYELLGDVRFRLGEFHQAGAAFGAARRLARVDAAAAGRLALKEAQIPYRFGRYPQALRRVTRGIHELEGVRGRAAAAHRARLYTWNAMLRYRQGQPLKAIGWCLEAERESRFARAPDALARAYLIHDLALVANDEVEKAVYGRKALAIYEELGELTLQASVLSNLGLVAWGLSRWDESLDLYARAKAIWETTGDRWNASFATYNIAEIMSDQGRYADAEPLLREVLRVWRASGAGPEIADAMCQLGRLLARNGDFESAWPLFQGAREEQVRNGERAAVLTTDARMAEAHVLAGHGAAALALAEKTLAQAQDAEGGSVLMPTLHRARGLSLLLDDRVEDARVALEEALRLARARNAEYEIALILDGLVCAHRLLGTDVGNLGAERDERLERLNVTYTPGLMLGVAVATPSTA